MFANVGHGITCRRSPLKGKGRQLAGVPGTGAARVNVIEILPCLMICKKSENVYLFVGSLLGNLTFDRN
jgi:hypothetical protein